MDQKSNQGIWQSTKNAVTIVLLGWLLGGLRVGLLGELRVGLLFGLGYGGAAFIQHFTLRLLLYFNGHIPWNLVPFLDYCTDRIFLRKVGGGYIFIHRLLMEYFASLEPEQPKLVKRDA